MTLLPPGYRFATMKTHKKEGRSMRINQVIRQRRKELSLTQAQVADYLGISTPAVNKWEKGLSVPDAGLLITI